ncbi:hypothetical protein QF027_000401 [Streptomyces canus]|nr:hypothetical protein [Streptomyces canus]
MLSSRLVSGIGTTTVHRYVTEAVGLLAALTPRLAEAMRAASMKACLILDGTLLPIDRSAADRPFSSGTHKRHGMHVRVVADPKGRLLWASPALAGAVHDVRAAREHGIIDALAEAGITCWTDKGYQGASGTVRLPYRGRWDHSPSVSRPPTDPRKGPGPGRTGHRHSQVLADPPQAPLLDDPNHQPRPSRPHPPSVQLDPRMEKGQSEWGDVVRGAAPVPGRSVLRRGCRGRDPSRGEWRSSGQGCLRGVLLYSGTAARSGNCRA